jgi:hypothetical protein
MFDSWTRILVVGVVLIVVAISHLLLNLDIAGWVFPAWGESIFRADDRKWIFVLSASSLLGSLSIADDNWTLFWCLLVEVMELIIAPSSL